MSRDIGSTNITEVNKDSLEVVFLVLLGFDSPLYLHTGIGDIIFDSNTYLGVGDLGSITGVEESEQLSPAPIELTLSGTISNHITEAMDAGNFGDIITIYLGYRDTDGTLVEDPWILARGTYEYATVQITDTVSKVSIIMQHDISRLAEKNGRRFSDEDQRNEFDTDEGFSFVHGIGNQTLVWGGVVINSSNVEDDRYDGEYR